MRNHNEAVTETISSITKAISGGNNALKQIIDSKHEITLNIVAPPKDAPDAVPYRYQATDTLSHQFLLAADPCLSGQEHTLVVDQVLRQAAANDQYMVERGAKVVRVGRFRVGD